MGKTLLFIADTFFNRQFYKATMKSDTKFILSVPYFTINIIFKNIILNLT